MSMTLETQFERKVLAGMQLILIAKNFKREKNDV